MHLKKWLHEKKMLVKEFAELIGYRPNYLSSVMSGSEKPTKKLMHIVMLKTDGEVNEKDWRGIEKDPLRTIPKRKK